MKKKQPSFPTGSYPLSRQLDEFKKPTGILRDSRGRLYIKDPKTGVIRRIRDLSL